MASGDFGLEVEGIRQLQVLFSKAGPVANKELQAGLRVVAEPVRTDWEGLARVRMRRIGREWYRARTGINRGLIYVAPVNRGVKGKDNPRRRGSKFSIPMNERVVVPALEKNKPAIEGAVNKLFVDLSRKWNSA